MVTSESTETIFPDLLAQILLDTLNVYREMIQILSRPDGGYRTTKKTCYTNKTLYKTFAS
jgi:hypothetical protein